MRVTAGLTCWPDGAQRLVCAQHAGPARARCWGAVRAACPVRRAAARCGVSGCADAPDAAQVRTLFAERAVEVWAVGSTAAYHLHLPRLYGRTLPVPAHGRVRGRTMRCSSERTGLGCLAPTSCLFFKASSAPPILRTPCSFSRPGGPR
jgi:hypothetical protein